MKGHRVSSLPLARFCGASAALGAQFGAGRAAELGSAFHALCAGVDGAERNSRLARLTEEELAEVLEWHKPADWTLPDGTVLSYTEAHKEGEVALDVNGKLCTADHPDCLTVGHYDMAWDVPHLDTVFVGDIKRSVWTAYDGTRSLQPMAYGYALALKYGRRYFCPGIWAATEGVWKWGNTYDMQDLSMGEQLATILAAANAPPTEYVTGTHCSQCYGRQHCKEYLLPVNDPEAVLAPMAHPGGITVDNAPKMIHLVQAAKKLIEIAESNLKAFADEQGGIRDGKGKVWKHLNAKEEGEKFNANKFRLENPELAQKYMETTPPRNLGHRWVKEKKEP